MAEAPPRALRTVIVEDNPEVADVQRSLIAEHGRFRVVAMARTGSAAVVAIRRTAPDVVVLDIQLPDFSGLDVLRWIRSEHSTPTEVIAVTAARDVDTVTTARAFGVRHYLVKPFGAGELRTRLDRIAENVDALAGAGGLLEQDGIDLVLLQAASAGGITRPKGINDHTALRVRTVLREAGADGISIDELSVSLLLSRSTSRRYLEYLAESGLAHSFNRFGGAGRPVKVYCSAESA